jgi:hypothetical protein
MLKQCDDKRQLNRLVAVECTKIIHMHHFHALYAALGICKDVRSWGTGKGRVLIRKENAAGQMPARLTFLAYLFLLRSLTSLITSSATFLGHGM